MVRDPALFRVLKQVVDTGEPVRQRVQLSGRSFDVNAALLANSDFPPGPSRFCTMSLPKSTWSA